MLPKGEPLRLKEPIERLSKREEPTLVISTKLLQELKEAMENTRMIQETQREESKSVIGKALSRRPAREAAEPDVVRSAASKISTRSGLSRRLCVGKIHSRVKFHRAAQRNQDLY